MTSTPTERDAPPRRYAHEIVPEPRTDDAPLLDLTRYHVARAAGLWRGAMDGTSAMLEPHSIESVLVVRTIAVALAEIRVALLHYQLWKQTLQGQTGQEIATWVRERTHENIGEWLREIGLELGIPMEQIRPYAAVPKNLRDTTSEPSARERGLERLAQHLAYEAKPAKCELSTDNGHKCMQRVAAVRWLSHFADHVCEEHAASAEERGALIVRCVRHDGQPYRQVSEPGSHIGSSKARQEVGAPGHCDDCMSVGHVKAHPNLGCGDAGCNDAHDEVRA